MLEPISDITNQQLSTVAAEEQKPATTSPESMGKVFLFFAPVRIPN
jgi:hypothetical protein